jgi:hypothetical protein
MSINIPEGGSVRHLLLGSDSEGDADKLLEALTHTVRAAIKVPKEARVWGVTEVAAARALAHFEPWCALDMDLLRRLVSVSLPSCHVSVCIAVVAPGPTYHNSLVSGCLCVCVCVERERDRERERETYDGPLLQWWVPCLRAVAVLVLHGAQMVICNSPR